MIYPFHPRKPFLCLLAMLLIPFWMNAQYQNSWFKATIDNCNGTIDITFVPYVDADNTFDDHTWDGTAKLKMKVGNGSEFLLGEMGDGHPGGTIHFSPNGEDVYYRKKSSYSQSVVKEETGGDSSQDRPFFVTIRVVLKSGDIGENITLTLEGQWEEGGSWSPQNVTSEKLPTAPTLTAADAEDCNSVQLNWSNPSGLCSGAKVEITRDDNVIASVDATDEKYPDNSAVSGSVHKYKIRYVKTYSGGFTSGGGFSTLEDGSRKTAPPQPSGFTASNTLCDKEVQLSWEWNEASPDNFKVYRNNQILQEIPGSSRTFTDKVPNLGTSYSYTISAINECGQGAQSVIDNGSSPDAPDQATNLQLQLLAGDKVQVNWTNNDQNGTRYKVIRIEEGVASELADLDSDSDSYLDEEIKPCIEYRYQIRVFNDCFQGGVGSETKTIVSRPDLSTAFKDGDFIASKGAYPDRVELSWRNGSNSYTEIIKIERRILGSNDDFVIIESDNTGDGVFPDRGAEAGIIYEYKLYGQGTCVGEVVKTNEIFAVGFRAPLGTITGTITYEGGVAVKNARVSAESSSVDAGISLKLGGNDSLLISPKSNLNPESELLIESWVNPVNFNQDFDLFNKKGSYRFHFDQSQNQLIFSIVGNSANDQIGAPASFLKPNVFSHIGAQMANDTLAIIINGQIVAIKAMSTGTTISSSNSAIQLGQGFVGNLDEVRIWHAGKDSLQLVQDYSRFMSGGEPRLMVYFRVNENVGETCYDYSKSGNIYNNNHAQMTSGMLWDPVGPDKSKLSAAGYTDENGNYIIPVPYKGIGESFVVRPALLSHEFAPGSRALYVGDGSFIYNNVDFVDKSSFLVSGTLFYSNSTCPVPNANLLIDGEIVTLDGNLITTDKDGNFDIEVPIGKHFITVSQAGHDYEVGRFPATGKYDFQQDLPGIMFKDSTKYKVLGRVVGGLREANKKPGLGLSKNNIGTAEVIFTSQNGCLADTVTTNSSTGEYVAYLPPLRYIPKAHVISDKGNQIDFGTQSLLDLSLISQLKSASDSVFVNAPDTIQSIDTMYNATQDTIISIDTTYNKNVKSLDHIDSVQYHEVKNFIYRVLPEISVKGPDGKSDFIGDTTYTYVNPKNEQEIVLNLKENPLPWPVFHQRPPDELYSCIIRVYERYVNIDDPNNPIEDLAPNIDGKLVVRNNLSHLPNLEVPCKEFNKADSTAFLKYDFKAGIPNLIPNNSVPEYSYTKTFELNLVLSNGTAIPWKPFAGKIQGGDGIYRAFLLGKQSRGQQFVSKGPEKVDYVLRDPPGTNSFAEREVGSEKKETFNWNWNAGGSLATKDEILVGAEFSSGIGVSVDTDLENNIKAGLKIEASGGHQGEQSLTITNTKAWRTDNSENDVGSKGDRYFATSQNIQFGITDILTIVPDSLCGTVKCLQADLDNPAFRLAESNGLSVVPEAYNTQVNYSQNHILNYLIPDLKDLRNAILSSNPKYQSKLPVDHENYGKNNDDPVFGALASTKNPNKLELMDYDGPSYKFTPESLQDSLQDSVRLVNKQIMIWEEAIRLNEWEKANIDKQSVIDSVKQAELAKLNEKYAPYVAAVSLLGGTAAIVGTFGLTQIVVPGASFAGYAAFAVVSATGIANAELSRKIAEYNQAKKRLEARFGVIPENYSIAGGTAFTESMTHQTASSYTKTFEYAIEAGLYNEIGAKVNGSGTKFEKSLEVSITSGYNWGEEASETETVTYTIDDPDQGDYFSFDVYPSMLGWGPIFKTRAGGATSCPHQDEERTLFYKKGTIISKRTQARDKPVIESPVTLLTNIPVGEAAVFEVNVANESEAGDPREYQLQLVSTSNPFGAFAKIDGAPPSQLIYFPAKASFTKTITIDKGPGPQYNYDSLLFVLYSPCQFAGGTSDNIDIVDSIYLSAHFLPTCTDVALGNPEEKWVLNNSFRDTLPIIINGYNYNFFDFKQLRFDYKASSSAEWIGVESFWKQPDSTGAQKPIPETQSYILYDWLVDQLNDGSYDLRVTSFCELAEKSSITYSGIIDRINPSAFGNPKPADGILDPNDEISIQFNEPIDLGSLTKLNFDVRGVLNGTETRHETSLAFDGIDDWVEVPGGASLANRPFTIEFSARRARSGVREAIVTQGIDAQQSLFVGFDAEDHFIFQVGASKVSSTQPIVDNEWHYFAVSFDPENDLANLYQIDDKINAKVNVGNDAFYSDYVANGRVNFGNNSANNAEYFNGNIHGIRMWSKALSLSEYSENKSKLLSGRELGLLFNWRMDEAQGEFVEDIVRRRDGTIRGPVWRVEPNGYSVDLDGQDDYFDVKSGKLAVTGGMDFTLEFWFNSSQTEAATLFYIGSGTNVDADSLTSWSIQKTATNTIEVLHYGRTFEAVSQDYFDGQWHHFALVLQRTGDLSAYIDGNLQNSEQAKYYNELAGPRMYLGAQIMKGTQAEPLPESFFSGKIDEFRFWTTARKLEQIDRDKQNRMMGDEPGLELYLAFENYKVDPTGIPLLEMDTTDQALPIDTIFSHGMLSFSNETPTIKLQRPVQSIAFTYSVNNDKIIITPTTSSELIENVTFDVTVHGVKDLNGNTMESPETWIAYVDLNQVVWQDDLFAFKKSLGEEVEFTSAVVNKGGEAKDFRIENIPDWLEVTPKSGTIPPNSVLEVKFMIDPLVNIGDYIEDILLITDFGFPEQLTVDLQVRSAEPDWKINPSDYEYSMSIVGRLKIKNVISSDVEDILAAFVGNELRGKAYLRYISQKDEYLVFLDVYSNTVSGEELTFKIWDASTGTEFTDVTPTLLPFDVNGNSGGTLEQPIIFETSNEISFDHRMKKGWNWIGYYLEPEVPDNLDLVLKSLDASPDYLIKSIDGFARYSQQNTWVGVLAEESIQPTKMYRLFTDQEDTLRISGAIYDPSQYPIHLNDNWNWIGFISVRNQSIKQALGNLDPSEGDLIKGKTQFAIYDGLSGWIGSLQTMIPGEGYMYRSKGQKSFTYPVAGLYRNNPKEEETFSSTHWTIDEAKFASNMTGIFEVNYHCQNILPDGEFAIGLFDNEGLTRAITPINSSESPVQYVTIFGDRPEKLDFKLLRLQDGIEYPIGQQLDFEVNRHLGSRQSPIAIDMDKVDCTFLERNEKGEYGQIAKVYPAVFHEQIFMEFIASQERQDALIEVYNLQGQLVCTRRIDIEAGYNKKELLLTDSNLAKGIYFLSFDYENEKVRAKIIKQ